MFISQRVLNGGGLVSMVRTDTGMVRTDTGTS